MTAAIVIPARFASTRLPGKPLLNATGKHLVQHVYERAVAAAVGPVIVATDDHRILDAVQSFGGQALMTHADHPSGTDRIAEVASSLTADLIVNLQGDEPQFDPAGVRLLLKLLTDDPGAGISTLATPIKSLADFHSPNVVKAVRADGGRALYFSRSPIPFVRDAEPVIPSDRFLHHLGVYAYRRDVLLKLAGTPPHPLEQAEKLEQLRALALGIPIQIGVIPTAHRGVDTPEDYAAFVAAVQAGGGR
ncbi:MAG: 3-deoxy-manno-octulosonate cytidylyltransferase [Fimbriiglobus sp.]|nr:3-deoxy-manno-octulosonate cytidylyltransferase [Fimbriiglobus sp.]